MFHLIAARLNKLFDRKHKQQEQTEIFQLLNNIISYGCFFKWTVVSLF